jgi:hypothetical protein
MQVTLISDSKDVYEFSVEDEDTSAFEGDLWEVVFENPADGDKSSRQMVAAQKTCTVTVEHGYVGEDIVTVTDAAGNEVQNTVAFGDEE